MTTRRVFQRGAWTASRGVALATFLLAAALLGACDDENDEQIAPPTVPPSAATAAATLAATTAATATAARAPTATSAAGRRTGIAAVDTVIDVVLAGDVEGLQRRWRYVPAPCGEQRGIGSPPACPPGQPTGTPVEVFPVGTCEGEIHTRPTVPRQLVPGFAQATLHSVYRVTPQQLPPIAVIFYRADMQISLPREVEYLALFHRPSPGGAVIGLGVAIAGSEVVGVKYGCPAGPEALVPPGAVVVLAPS